MKEFVKAVVKFLDKYFGSEAVQRKMLKLAEKLAAKTSPEFDDELVSFAQKLYDVLTQYRRSK